ncbi:MAG: hypothetical protein CL797_02580 [Chromatiales bacterium]|nr:hypothetical protein [Chromatiales bacterium]
MLADSYIVPQCVYGPGSFGGLMALYESNYLQLIQLLGPMEIGPAQNTQSHINHNQELSSCSADDEDLFLKVESSTRYTQILRLTYMFEEPDGSVADPDLCLRGYLDARMTEVVSWAAHHRHAVLHDLHSRITRPVGRCWSRNMVLSKWLDFLLEKGHSFKPVTRKQGLETA